MLTPADHIRYGCEHPYDDASDQGESYTGTDPARRAVYGILSNLSDRGGIKRELGRVEDEVRSEIVESLTAIVREAIRIPPRDLDSSPP